MEITTTLPPGGGDHEDHRAVVRVLPAADVSERPVDEGETEKGKPQKGDYRVDPNHVPGLEDESEEENEAPPGLEADESSSIGIEGALE